MTARLLNAAVMPREGIYHLRQITPAEFARLVDQQKPVSYIGYHNAAVVLSRLCNCQIAINRESTPMEDGDYLLIARLKYRVGNPAAKGQVEATVHDYEFFECLYEARVPIWDFQRGRE